jgi:hypothetical protein
MSKTNHGTVVIESGDITFTLKPTLRAFREIQRHFGGVMDAIQVLTRANISSLALIVSAATGVDIGKRKDVEAVEEQIFEAGATTVASQLLPYLQALLNPAGKTNDEIAKEKEESSGNE